MRNLCGDEIELVAGGIDGIPEISINGSFDNAGDNVGQSLQSAGKGGANNNGGGSAIAWGNKIYDNSSNEVTVSAPKVPKTPVIAAQNTITAVVDTVSSPNVTLAVQLLFRSPDQHGTVFVGIR